MIPFTDRAEVRSFIAEHNPGNFGFTAIIKGALYFTEVEFTSDHEIHRCVKHHTRHNGVWKPCDCENNPVIVFERQQPGFGRICS
jgi:hypothetical protein